MRLAANLGLPDRGGRLDIDDDRVVECRSDSWSA